MQSSSGYIWVSCGRCTSWNLIDVEYQTWFLCSALSDTLIAISMTVLVIIKKSMFLASKFKTTNSLYAITLLRSEGVMFYAE